MSSDADDPADFLRALPEGTELRLHLQPRASRNRVAGLHGDRLRLTVTAAPVEGRANEELCRFLATALRLPTSAVLLTRGARGRRKTVLVKGLSPDAVRSRLGV